MKRSWFISIHWPRLCLHDKRGNGILRCTSTHLCFQLWGRKKKKNERAEEADTMKDFFWSCTSSNIFSEYKVSTHKHSHDTPREEKGSGGRGFSKRTYLFLSDSCRKNSLDVNERQLALIKNLIAPQHAMQRYQNKIMIHFC